MCLYACDVCVCVFLFDKSPCTALNLCGCRRIAQATHLKVLKDSVSNQDKHDTQNVIQDLRDTLPVSPRTVISLCIYFSFRTSKAQHLFTQIGMYKHARTYIHTHIHACLHTCIHTCIHAYRICSLVRLTTRNPQTLFREHVDGPIQAVCVSDERIFLAYASSVRGFSRKGKPFFAMDACLSEPVRTL